MVAELVRRFALALAFYQLALAAAATITSQITAAVSSVLQFRSPVALPVNAFRF